LNQILISSKVYVTKELKRKQRIYQTIFLISILVIVSLLVYYFIAEKQKKKTASTTVSFIYDQRYTDLVFVIFFFHFLARDGA